MTGVESTATMLNQGLLSGTAWAIADDLFRRKAESPDVAETKWTFTRLENRGELAPNKSALVRLALTKC